MLLLNEDHKIILVSHNCLHYLGHQNVSFTYIVILKGSRLRTFSYLHDTT